MVGDTSYLRERKCCHIFASGTGGPRNREAFFFRLTPSLKTTLLLSKQIPLQYFSLAAQSLPALSAVVALSSRHPPVVPLQLLLDVLLHLLVEPELGRLLREGGGAAVPAHVPVQARGHVGGDELLEKDRGRRGVR